MAINIRCPNCKSEMSVSSKKCEKCNTAIPTKGKKYRVIVRVNGNRVTKIVPTLELARKTEAKLKMDVIRDEFDVNKKKAVITLDDLWTKYLPYITTNKKTWEDDALLYNKHIKPELGLKRLDVISPVHIEHIITKMKNGRKPNGKNYAPATIRHVLILLSRLFSIAEKWDIYSGSNPCKKVEKPKVNNQVTEFLTDDELEKLLNVLETWHNRMTAGFISFLLHTGLRRGELFQLKWQDVDLNRKTILLKNPKGKVDQNLPLSDKAVAILKQLPREFDTDFIFYGKDGNQRVDFKGSWLRIRKAAGLPETFRLHGLRHHFASSLVSNGVDLYTVQKLLCHKDSSMTQRYAHLADKTLRDAVNMSDELLNRD